MKQQLDRSGIEMPSEIVALQATDSFAAAIQGSGDVDPAGSLVR